MITYADLQRIEQIVAMHTRMCLPNGCAIEQFEYSSVRLFQILSGDYQPENDPDPQGQNENGILNLNDYQGDVKALVYPIYQNPTWPFRGTDRRFNTHERHALQYWVKVSLMKALFECYDENNNVQLPTDLFKNIIQDHLHPDWRALHDSVKDPQSWLQTCIPRHRQAAVVSGLGWASYLSLNVLKCSLALLGVSLFGAMMIAKVFVRADLEIDEHPTLFAWFQFFHDYVIKSILAAAISSCISGITYMNASQLENTGEFPIPEVNPEDLPSQYTEMFNELYGDAASHTVRMI